MFDEFELELLEEFERVARRVRATSCWLEFDDELLEEFMLEFDDEFELEFELEFPAVANGAPTATTPVAARAAAHFLLSI